MSWAYVGHGHLNTMENNPIAYLTGYHRKEQPLLTITGDLVRLWTHQLGFRDDATYVDDLTIRNLEGYMHGFNVIPSFIPVSISTIPIKYDFYVEKTDMEGNFLDGAIFRVISLHPLTLQ